MATRSNLTDRAYRYRAVSNAPEGPAVCGYCGSKSNVEVEHIDGREENTDDDNLMWACRSCNTIKGKVFANLGLGRRTRQYNPAGGAKSLGDWVRATMSARGLSTDMSVESAVDMIRATSARKRSEFAQEIWNRRRAHGNPAKFDRCVKAVKKKGGAANAYAVCAPTRNKGKCVIGNPVPGRSKHRAKNPPEAAARLFEEFHGYPATEFIEVDEELHYHSSLTGLGALLKLVIKVPREQGGGSVTLKKFKGPDGETILCSNEDGTQLYLRGGDQSVPLEDFGLKAPFKDAEYLGQLKRLDYFTVKTHLGKEGGEAVYYHAVGEENGVMPRVKYDTLNDRIEFIGGDYHIEPEGIRN